jgi:hypothetical protein
MLTFDSSLGVLHFETDGVLSCACLIWTSYWFRSIFFMLILRDNLAKYISGRILRISLYVKLDISADLYNNE